MNIHLPTCILLNTLVESNMPVIAPNGESSNDRPRLPSEKPSLYLIPGMEATQVPNTRLDVENRKPTATAGFIFMNEEMFLIIMGYEIFYLLLPIKIRSRNCMRSLVIRSFHHKHFFPIHSSYHQQASACHRFPLVPFSGFVFFQRFVFKQYRGRSLS